MDGGPDKENRRVEIYGVRTVVGQNVAPPAEVDGARCTPHPDLNIEALQLRKRLPGKNRKQNYQSYPSILKSG